MTAKSRWKPAKRRKPKPPPPLTAREIADAAREFDRNKRLVDSGETYAAHKWREWRVGNKGTRG